ncbi:MAG: Immune inhibitor A precursor [Bacteroidetes bacterium ADurb.Bin408]|nr:MAG: Immune inhibitor A precursor [Bacteroidetes bacterium ADurb.Bin408]
MKKQIPFILAVLCFFIKVGFTQSQTVVFGNGAYVQGETFEYTQPDNTALTVKLWGDAVINWLETEDGYKLAENEQGYLDYASADIKGHMIPSGVMAKNKNERTRADVDFLNTLNKNIFYSDEQLQLKRNMAVYGKGAAEDKMGGFPATGNRKLLVILARFSDQPFTYAQSAFNNLFNAANYSGSGCFKDYFYEVSYGQLVVTTTVTQVVTLPNTRAYYGANTGGAGTDSKAALAVRHAIQAAYNAGVNFSPFDNNNDGYIDLVAVIHSGLGEETSGNTADIWSHNWSLSASGYGTLTLGGKTFNNYTIQPEKYTTSIMTNIGVICHEFGHAIGLPDFYDTNGGAGGSYGGTGDWDLMASGTWLNSGRKPAHPNAWSKVYLGWVTPVTLTVAANVTVKNVEQNKQIYRINTSVSNDYFLLENRQKTGFDSYIPQSGLLIYHVHPQLSSYISSNSINTTHPQRLYIVPAGSASDPKAGNYGSINATSTPFPGTSNKTSFTDNTVPNMKTWSGASVNKPITYITHNTSTKEITFKFMGGTTTTGSLPEVTTLAASNITASTAKLNGTVKGNNTKATVTFQIWTSSNSSSPWEFNANPSTVSGNTNTAVSITLGSLTAGVTYYFRVKATNANGTVTGSTLNFKIASNMPYEPTALLNPEVLAEDINYEQDIHLTDIETENPTPDLLRVFPNPSSDFLILDNSLGFSKVSIHGFDGRLIWEENTGNEKEILINIRNFMTGTYIIVAENASVARRARFVVSR